MPNETQQWPFADPKNVAAFTTRFVMTLNEPIVAVYHNYEDGAWQFHSNRASDERDLMLVALSEVWEKDPSIGLVNDLPYGWKATRTTPVAPWRGEKHHPYPTYEENGFYLEDASLYEEQISLPDQKAQESCAPGDLVKLVFRFAKEHAERRGGECERMWLSVEEVHDAGHYTGRLENQPSLHDAIEEGALVIFSPIHIIAIEQQANT
ncbi:hypothetical protein [Roseimicrobium sp. ORNL1]|uniref:hypothetical protein n=1 Tax=Roseimicrobium sp. ORNL1 TaxID=2711231 RepID=UPI0019800740|nr:hypothetical protein [Roseimicrobium sp. ORNL1]